MDGLTFVAKLVESLAWPLTVLFAAIYLIRNLDRLAIVTKSLKFKDVEVNFREKFEQIKEVATESNITVQYAQFSAPETMPSGSVGQLAAVMAAWQEIEDVLNAWKSGKDAQLRAKSSEATLRHLHREKLIPSDLFEIAKNLLDIRNQAARAVNFLIPGNELSEYRSIARSVASRLRQRLMPAPAPPPLPPAFEREKTYPPAASQ